MLAALDGVMYQQVDIVNVKDSTGTALYLEDCSGAAQKMTDRPTSGDNTLAHPLAVCMKALKQQDSNNNASRFLVAHSSSTDFSDHLTKTA
jgi:hypothetical protein